MRRDRNKTPRTSVGDTKYQLIQFLFNHPQIVFVLQAQYEPEESDFANEVAYHGDFVKDVAFQVENLDYILEYARKQGAVVVKDLWQEEDEFGVVRMATVKTVGVLRIVFL